MVVGEKVKNIKERKFEDHIKMIPREQWKAQNPTGEMLPLEVPLHNIIFTWTDTEPCEMPHECKQRVRDVQKAHMDKGLPDIQYNFLVGGDKQIYVGRGWQYEPPRYPEDVIENAYIFNGKCVEIAFIEKHMSIPPVYMINKVSEFLALSMMENKVIKPCNIRGIKDNQIVRFSELMNEHYKDYSDRITAKPW